MTEPTRSLHRKLSQIMYEAERIPKRGTAPVAMGGYKFVQVGDAADYIRKALAEHVLTMLPTGVRIVGQADRPTKAGGLMTTVDLITTWTITDGESGESITVESFGAGADGGDKYSGKASTSAMKYALLTTFLLSTGEDTELGGPEAADPEAGKPKGHATPAKADTEGKPGEPTYVSQGTKSYVGTVAKGDGQFNDVQYHQTPSGHLLGFRLELEGGGAIHEALVTGPIAEALFLAVPDSKELLKATVEIEGETFRIDQQGRRARARLVATRIKGPGFTIPAAEAPSEPMFDGKADAELDNLAW